MRHRGERGGHNFLASDLWRWLRGAGGRQHLDLVGARFLQRRNLLLLFFDEWIELRNLLRVLALLVFAEEEEVGVVLRAPSVEEQFVLLADRLAQFLGLIEIR